MKQNIIIKIIIFLIPLSFFILQFSLRLTPGIFISDIMQSLSINATKFGIFSSMYYFGYAGMQVPIGVLLDYFHPKKVISLLFLLCSISTIGTIFTDNWIIASFFRFLIGIASVAGFIGCAKVIREIFNENLYNKMISITFSVGFIGTFIYINNSYNELSHNATTWQTIFKIDAIILLILSVAGFIALSKINMNDNLSKNNIINNLKLITKNKYIITTSIAGGLMVGAFEGFADVWGNSFLIKAYNLNKESALKSVSLIYLGIGIGAPIIAYISDKFNNHSKITYITGIINTIFLVIIIYFPFDNYYLLCIICFIIGLLSSNQVLIFSMTAAKSAKNHISVTSALTNSCVMGFGLLLHNIIGYLMDYNSRIKYNYINNYSLEAYQLALTIIPLTCFIGSIIIKYINKNQK